MEQSKGWLLLVILLLGIFLAFSLFSVEALLHAIKENRTLQAENVALGNALQSCMLECESHTPKEELPTVDRVDEPRDRYVVRSVNDLIAVYTETGSLVRLLEIDPAHLPAADREALANGITLDRWEDVLSLIADYTA